jgi:single-stranded DNA-binding protein
MFISHCFLVGNVGGEPQVKLRTDGTVATSVSLAVNRPKTNGEEKVFETEWYRVYAYGKTGERLAKVGKGDRLFVGGTFRVLQDKNRNVSVLIIANYFSVLKPSKTSVSLQEKKEMESALDELAETFSGETTQEDIDEFPF